MCFLADKLELHRLLVFQKKSHEAELFKTNFILSTFHVIYVKVAMVSILFLTHDKYNKNIFSKKKHATKQRVESSHVFWCLFLGGGFTNVFPTSSKRHLKRRTFQTIRFPRETWTTSCGASSGWTPLSTFISTIATAVITLVILIFFWGGEAENKEKHEVKR